jgi:serine phosphatase RsbU (regulator of sigma subunit)
MLRQLNQMVIQNIGSSLFFFTLFVARVDRSGRRMVFAGAGHPPAMIVKPGEEPRLLESRSTVLGVLPDAVDPEPALEVQLEAGERIVLYTDGITDVFNSEGKMLGVAGVQRFVQETATLPLREMRNAILERVAEWRVGQPADDISLILVEV